MLQITSKKISYDGFLKIQVLMRIASFNLSVLIRFVKWKNTMKEK